MTRVRPSIKKIHAFLKRPSMQQRQVIDSNSMISCASSLYIIMTGDQTFEERKQHVRKGHGIRPAHQSILQNTNDRTWMTTDAWSKGRDSNCPLIACLCSSVSSIWPTWLTDQEVEAQRDVNVNGWQNGHCVLRIDQVVLADYHNQCVSNGRQQDRQSFVNVTRLNWPIGSAAVRAHTIQYI